MAITKQVNQALTMQQKAVLFIKIIELVYADEEISERQGNLIFYIGEALKISRKDMLAIREFVLGFDLEDYSVQNILIIDEGSGDCDFKGPRIIQKHLTGMVAILRLADIETYFIKYIGISVLYLNGQPLKSRKIDVFPTGSSIRGDKIDTIYYSDIVSKFLREGDKTQITFSAEHIFYHFKSGRAGLQNVNISEKGGKLIGIMGASGSGKSTLLNVINGTETPSSGRVLINGVNIHEEPKKVEGVIGYIPQDDLLLEDLTVYENIYYAAKLCFAHYNNKEIDELVQRVMSSLGIGDIKDLRVGSPLQKTISGGQRKRVNIALELLREPSLLFVDEPTSGLSSQDSENIMDLLKELSLRGKMVFVVIHQPSSDIFKMFDNLLILDVGGLQIYYGNPTEAITYFKELINAANKKQGVCPECGNINPEQIFSIIETKVVNEFGRFTKTRKVSPGQWYQYFKDNIKLPRVRHVKERIDVSINIPNWLKQYVVYTTRDFKSKLSNRQYLAINLLQAPLLALFMGFMVKYHSTIEERNPVYTFFENDNIPVYFFMSIIVALFMGLTVSAEEIFRDRKLLKRERFLNLSKSSYLIAKITVLFLISAIQTATFAWIGNAILEIQGMTLSFWLILFSCAAFSNVLGLNISASFNSAVTIYILIPLLLIPQLLLSGVVISFDKFNPSVSKLDGVPVVGELMASRWAFEAAMVTQFKDNAFESRFYDLDQEAAIAEYKKLYYVPRLQTELSYVFNNRNKRLTAEGEKLKSSLTLIRNEINRELDKIGRDKFQLLDQLALDQFDSATHEVTAEFLKDLRRYYVLKYNRAFEKKSAIIDSLTRTEALKAHYDSVKFAHQNEAVETAVKNINTTYRIIELNGRLIQKIYPIYFKDHDPDHFFDFRTKFYAPKKYFAGSYIDTLYFNVAMIWVMSVILYVTLYYDLLRKLMNYLTSKTRRRYN